MINVQEAIKKASSYLTTFYPSVTNVRLEEVEITLDEKFWNITFSFDDASKSVMPFTISNREYKIIKINTDSGEFKSMKIGTIK
jgi:hypothetical protein